MAQDRNDGGISRRACLGGAALVLGGGAAALTSSAAWAKVDQKAAMYQDKPKDGKMCSGCAPVQSTECLHRGRRQHRPERLVPVLRRQGLIGWRRGRLQQAPGRAFQLQQVALGRQPSGEAGEAAAGCRPRGGRAR